MDSAQLKGILTFLHRTENLKNTLRSAHTSTGRQESTAEHTWRLCLLVMALARHLDGVDPFRMLKLAIIHDLGEALCGDTPAILQVLNRDKSGQERAAMLELTKTLPLSGQAELLSLWEEYEAGESPEAKIIKGLDKLETIFQHNQGDNPPDFDYAFNLEYGREYTDAHPLLRQIRALIDPWTRQRAQKQPPEQT